MIRFIFIGITDNPGPFFAPEVLEIIRNGRVFSGGRRHHEIVASLLPEGAKWIDITVPLDKVIEEYREEGRRKRDEGTLQRTAGHGGTVTIVTFVSGDPLFFGFANTIKRRMPEAEIVVYPTFNSLQMLAHRLVMPYHDMRIVSLTGRPWQEFDKALIEGAEKIGVLTDKEHNPASIARRMTEYGYTHYDMYVGEHLGNPETEKVSSLSLEEASERSFSMPNCLMLVSNSKSNCLMLVSNRKCKPELSNHTSKPRFGIPDSDFVLLDGREKMITKMPIRLLTLQALELPERRVFWDIGFCTGSVSIEARLQFPHLQIEAFEIRPECEAIINENTRRHGAPGIGVHIGDFLKADISTLPRPDAVFIGGHGGYLKEIMEKVLTVLSDEGVIVFNSVVAPKVTTDSCQLWDKACEELGLHQEQPLHIQLNDNHPITILKCRKP